MENIPSICLNIALSLFGFITAFSALSSSLSIDLEGHIKDQCEISFNSGNQIDVSDSIHESLPFDLYCNRPFIIEISSVNGGLKLNHNSFELIEPYVFEIEIDKINFKSKSQELNDVKNVSSFGVIPFSSRGEIKVTLEHGLLYSGHYQDTVEIDVIPNILSNLK